VARPQREVVRVGEDEVRADLTQVIRIERLHGRIRADGHEHRRFHGTVRRIEATEPGAGAAVRRRGNGHLETDGASPAFAGSVASVAFERPTMPGLGRGHAVISARSVAIAGQ